MDGRKTTEPPLTTVPGTGHRPGSRGLLIPDPKARP